MDPNNIVSPGRSGLGAWHPGNYWLEVGAGLYPVVSVGWFYFVNQNLHPMLRSVLLCLTVLTLSWRKLPAFETIDSDQWKKDRNACGGYRQGIRSSIDQDIAKLKGLSENDLFNLLGRPDQNELYKRNQKFYSYFFSRRGWMSFN